MTYSTPLGVIKTFMIFAESSPSAVMAMVHFGIAWIAHIDNTTRIAFLLVERFLNHLQTPS